MCGKRKGVNFVGLILVVLVLVAFGLRMYRIDAFGFWTDEGLTPLRSGYSLVEILSNRIVIQEGITKDTHPPFYYLLIHFSRLLFGESDFAYRYPSVLAGVLLVPLMYQLGRRLHTRALGLWAAGITAVNPLQVWYANEARMYTLYVVLAAGAAYALWRAIQGSHLYRYLVVYFVLSGLAFYTHYTAVFLIAAQTPFWVYLLWQRGQKRLILGTAVLGMLVVIPVIPFTIPRLFTGAEANYFYVPPFIMLQDVIHAFGLGLTTHFEYLLTRLLDIGMAVLVFSGLYGLPNWRTRLFVLVYLFAVVAGLMLGSLIKPMYQGARHIMVGSPALYLLAASGIVWWLTKSRISYGWQRMAARGISAVLLLVLIAGPTVALQNYFFDDTFGKDDFRGLIHYIETHAGENDLIIYNNAVLLPLHAHYQQRADVTAIGVPVYPYQANENTDLLLAKLAKQYDRIWFVTDPPADKRDAGGRVQAWLDSHLLPIEVRHFPGRTTEVKFVLYRTKTLSGESLPQTTVPLNIQWPQTPRLVGINPLFSQPARLPALWLDLFWQGNAPAEEMHLRFSVRDINGQVWWVWERPFVLNPDLLRKQWSSENITHTPQEVFVPAGLPPGEYTLWLQPLATATGPALGEATQVLSFQIAPTTEWLIAPEISFTSPFPIHFANGLRLQGYTVPVPVVKPGHTLPISLYWQSSSPTFTNQNLRYRIDIVDKDGNSINTREGNVGAEWLTQWPNNALIRQDTGLYFSPETTPGTYRLRWQLIANGNPVAGRPSWRPWFGKGVLMGEIVVEPWPMVTERPTDAAVMEARFGDAIALYGYKLGELENGRLPLTLYWEALDTPPANYLVFVHLVNPADNQIVSQIDRIPVNGLRPTRGWRIGEILTDQYELTIPDTLEAGDYTINIGLYLGDTGERLPVSYQNQLQENNQLSITTLTLP